jgi:flagellar basal body rod protein FlgC
MVSAISIALTGMESATRRLESSAAKIANMGTSGDVNFAEEAVNMMIAKTSYKANIAVLMAQEEMDDALGRAFDKKV